MRSAASRRLAPLRSLSPVFDRQWEEGADGPMARGERSQTWFPEMVASLRTSWRADLSWSEIVELRQKMQAQLEQIRASRGIRPPVSTCPVCGRTGPEAARRVSVRAMLLALSRFSIESEDVVQELEKGWAKHRAAESLDLEGAPASSRTLSEAHQHPPDAS